MWGFFVKAVGRIFFNYLWRFEVVIVLAFI